MTLAVVIASIALGSSSSLESAFAQGPAVHVDSSPSEMDIHNVTTTWNLSFLYPDGDAALSELERTRSMLEKINMTYRPAFGNLSGSVLYSYIEDEKEFSKNLNLLYAYSYARNSLDVNDPLFGQLLSDVQNLSAEHDSVTSFAEIRLKSLSRAEWDRLFADEPGLDIYRFFFEDRYIRYSDHRPRNETHAAFLANISNQLMKLETESEKRITNNVTIAGNISLTDGREIPLNSESYWDLLFTDTDRENRKMGYDKRFYHMLNESDEMAEIYVEKAGLDDLYARELNFTDAYSAKMFDTYLNASQVDEMNSVFKERKTVFNPYYELRRELMGLETLEPYDLFLQLTTDPGLRYNYTDALEEVYGSYSSMDPAFREILMKTVTGNYIDVYPNPEGGKQSGGYCIDLCARKLPALIFLNYKGLLDDKSTLIHEMGHATCDYLMGNSVDYLYCSGPEYEMEVPSTFNEELLLDYAMENYDRETAAAVLADHIRSYESTFTLQPMITDFERQAHRLIDEQRGLRRINGTDLHILWREMWKEYMSEQVEWYDEGEAKWTYMSHIYITNNYYTFSYALSESITLALFKKYKENPDEFNRNYIAYLSAGATMTPPEKLRRYFGMEIDRQLFEDAMDMVEMRVRQLEDLERGSE